MKEVIVATNINGKRELINFNNVGRIEEKNAYETMVFFPSGERVIIDTCFAKIDKIAKNT